MSKKVVPTYIAYAGKDGVVVPTDWGLKINVVSLGKDVVVPPRPQKKGTPPPDPPLDVKHIARGETVTISTFGLNIDQDIREGDVVEINGLNWAPGKKNPESVYYGASSVFPASATKMTRATAVASTTHSPLVSEKDRAFGFTVNGSLQAGDPVNKRVATVLLSPGMKYVLPTENTICARGPDSELCFEVTMKCAGDAPAKVFEVNAPMYREAAGLFGITSGEKWTAYAEKVLTTWKYDYLVRYPYNFNPETIVVEDFAPGDIDEITQMPRESSPEVHGPLRAVFVEVDFVSTLLNAENATEISHGDLKDHLRGGLKSPYAEANLLYQRFLQGGREVVNLSEFKATGTHTLEWFQEGWRFFLVADPEDQYPQVFAMNEAYLAKMRGIRATVAETREKKAKATCVGEVEPPLKRARVEIDASAPGETYPV